MEKVTIEVLCKILDKYAFYPLSTKDLAEKFLSKDLGMDEIDMTGMSNDIERLTGISIPDGTWYEWKVYFNSLTVQHVLDDCNNI